MPPRRPVCRVRAGRGSRQAFWASVDALYAGGTFCDVVLVPGGEGGDGGGVCCHSLVLAAVSKTLKAVLPATETDPSTTIRLPDFSRADVAAFVDSVYGLLSGRATQDALLLTPVDLLEALDVDLLQVLKDEQEEEQEEGEVAPTKRNAGRKRRATSPEHAVVHKTRKKKPESRKAPPPPPDAERLYVQMKDCSGSFKVDVREGFLDPSEHLVAKVRARTSFQVLVGVVAGHCDSRYRAKPLAWTPLDMDDDPTEQYKETCLALRSVFGLSTVEAHYSSLAYARQGASKKNPFHKVRYVLRTDLLKSSAEELEAVVGREDVVAVTSATSQKPQLTIQEGEAEMVLDSNLALEEIEGVMLVIFFADGSTSGHVLRVSCDGSRKDDVAACQKAMFDVWSEPKVRKYDGKCFQMPGAPEIIRIYDGLVNVCEEYKVARELLDDADGSRRKKLMSMEKQCDECGKVFYLENTNLLQKFWQHKKTHQIQDFKCDCSVDVATFRTFKEKKAHVKLYHSEGKFGKCEYCDFVARPEVLEQHSKKIHPEGSLAAEGESKGRWRCSTCGVTLKNTSGYYKHMRTHKVYTCKHCQESILGHETFLAHKKKFHPQQPVLYRCDQCGRDYVSKRKLKEHVVRVHTPDKDRPYQCQDCDRGFARGLELNAHRIMAHIKNRPFACRYGCGVAYNDASSRGTHERKKHGATFPKGTKGTG